VITTREITGFVGSEMAEEVKIIPEFVNGIPVYLQDKLPIAILPKGIVQLEVQEKLLLSQQAKMPF
jgi:hypothetical protein